MRASSLAIVAGVVLFVLPIPGHFMHLERPEVVGEEIVAYVTD